MGRADRQLAVKRGELLQDAAIGGPFTLGAYALTRNRDLEQARAAVNVGSALTDMALGSRARGEREPMGSQLRNPPMTAFEGAAKSEDFLSFYHGTPAKNLFDFIVNGVSLSKSRETNSKGAKPTKRITGNDFGGPAFYMDRDPDGIDSSIKILKWITMSGKVCIGE